MKRNITLLKLFYSDTSKEEKEKSAFALVVLFFKEPTGSGEQ